MDNTETMQVRAVPGYHPITLRLIELLQGKSIGTVVTDDDLQDAAGIDVSVGSRGYGYLMSAQRYCEKNGQIWQRIRGAECIKRLNPDETLTAIDSDISAINRKGKRGVNKINSIDERSLDNPQLVDLRTRQAQIGMLIQMSTRKVTKQIKAEGSQFKLDTSMLSQFTEQDKAS